MSAAEINLALNYFIEMIRSWWWVFLPFVLWKPFSFLYLWQRNEEWSKRQKMVLLEIKLPKEIAKPIRATEQVMASLHAVVYKPPNWWEKWIDGESQLSLSFEIASIGGEPHFFVRTEAAYKDAVEASFYSQYPEIEIQEVDDYTKYVPQDIPNKDWDLFASDYQLIRDDHYPIKTYPKFETEVEKTEERKIDPMSTLLEAMAKIRPGEQLWVQFIVVPIGQSPLAAWIAKGEAVRDKLFRRQGVPPPIKPTVQEVVEILITGKKAETEAKNGKTANSAKAELTLLTLGERDVVTALEAKMSKPIFKCIIRTIYLGKRDVWFKPNFRLIFAFFNSFTTLNLNALFPLGKTITSIHKSWLLPLNIIRSRRHYLRCRRIFTNYIDRLSPFFPRGGGTFMLNTEEMASLFHFPSKAVAPGSGLVRIAAKKRGVPADLPVE